MNKATSIFFSLSFLGASLSYADVRNETLDISGTDRVLVVERPATVEDYIVRTAVVYRDARGETLDIKGTDRLLRVVTVNSADQSIAEIAVYNTGGPDEVEESQKEIFIGEGLTPEESAEIAGEIGYGEAKSGTGFYDDGLEFSTESVLRSPIPISKPIHITNPVFLKPVVVVFKDSNNVTTGINVVYDIKPNVLLRDGRPIFYLTTSAVKQWLVGSVTNMDRGGTVGLAPQVQTMDNAGGAGDLLIGSVVQMSLESESERAIRELREKLAQKPEDNGQSEEAGERSDPASAGKLLYVAGANQVNILRQLEPNWQPSNIVMQVEPTFDQLSSVGGWPIVRQIEPAFIVAADGLGKGGGVIMFETESGQEVVSETVFRAALETINNAGLEITSEGVLVAGSVVTGAALIWKYGKSLNPVGAFFLGLGIGPAAASDYCSRFEGEEGLRFYFTMSLEDQLNEASMCSDLAGKVLVISEEVSSN